MIAGTGLDTPAKPVDHELTPAQHAMDDRDWSFEGLWPYKPRWHWADGVRLHYVDEGPSDAAPFVMVHGSPTWSFLYRKLIVSLRRDGRRAVALDHLGFGRSDKPHRQGEYSLDRHASLFESLLDRLDLRDVILVVHEWGGPIGLAWAIRHPDRVKALVVLNSFVDPLDESPEARVALLRAPGASDLLLKGAHRSLQRAVRADATGRRLTSDELRGYEEPHPSWDSRTGILAFARAVAGARRDATRAFGDAIDAGLSQLADKPALIAWGMEDEVLSLSSLSRWRARLPHASVLELEGVGHLVPEAATDRLAGRISDLAAEEGAP